MLVDLCVQDLQFEAADAAQAEAAQLREQASAARAAVEAYRAQAARHTAHADRLLRRKADLTHQAALMREGGEHLQVCVPWECPACKAMSRACG